MFESDGLTRAPRLYLMDHDWTHEDVRNYHEHLVTLVKQLIIKLDKPAELQITDRVSPRPSRRFLYEVEADVQAFSDTTIELAFKAISSGRADRYVDCRDGRWIEYTLLPREDKRGEVDKLTIRVADITEQKYFEETLLKFEERYRSLLEGALVSVGITDFEGNVLLANPMMLEMTGFSLEEIKSVSVHTLYADPFQHERVFKLFEYSGKVSNFEMALKRKDGEIYSVLLNMDPINLAGHRLLFMTTHDLTQITQ
jgi:PAS domain S-box-containing protein